MFGPFEGAVREILHNVDCGKGSCSEATCDLEDQILVCSVADLAPGDSARVRVARGRPVEAHWAMVQPTSPQGRPLGTGHAVMVAEKAVGRARDVLVVPGDNPLLTGDMLRQGDVTVVNFWASWCLPCRAEAPLFARAHAEHGEQIEFIGIDVQDSQAAAQENPDQEFAIVDVDFAEFDADGNFVGDVTYDNVKELTFQTDEAAFLAGYLAAGYSEAGKVGTFGGMPFPTVTIFMDGFKQGAEYYAEENGKDVEVVGWDGKNGSFTGGFEANEAATSTAKQILDQDVDVILPVGGPIYQGAITAIEDSGKDIAMIGVDADLYETDPSTQEYVMTSILKGMKVSTYEAVMAAGNDEFDFEPYVGTLENDGVGIAPFHNFEDKVNPDLAAQLDEVKAGIIDGSIEVESYLG